MKALEDVRIIDLFFERDETAIRYVSEKYGKPSALAIPQHCERYADSEECENDNLCGGCGTLFHRTVQKNTCMLFWQG